MHRRSILVPPRCGNCRLLGEPRHAHPAALRRSPSILDVHRDADHAAGVEIQTQLAAYAAHFGGRIWDCLEFTSEAHWLEPSHDRAVHGDDGHAYAVHEIDPL